MAKLLVRRRANEIESFHEGDFVCYHIVENCLFSTPNEKRYVYPRSAIKPVHALPFITSGAAKNFAATSAEIVLSASSHVAIPEQLAALTAFAERLGIAGRDLICGADFPLGQRRRGTEQFEPSAFENNNAGKHLGVIATCLVLGDGWHGYQLPDHPAQRRLNDVTALLCGIDLPTRFAIENCGMPTFSMPLDALARGMARLSSPETLPAPIARAAETLADAIAVAPDFLTGPRRLSTEIVRVTRGRVIAKGGAEGVYSALDRALHRGYALKVDDGSGEASSAIIVELLEACGSLSDQEAHALRRFTQFWAHPFAPERSPGVYFPLADEIRRARRELA